MADRTSEHDMLRTRYEELDLLYRSAPVGLALLDTDLRYVRINDRLAEINGMSPEDIIGRTIHEVAPDIAPKVEPIYRHVINTGKPSLNNRLEGTVRSDPHSSRSFLASYSPLGVGGEVRGVSAVVTDVTDQKEVEDKLRWQERLVDTFMEHSPVGIYIKDSEKKATFANQVVLDVFGLSREEFLGTRARDTMPPEAGRQIEAVDDRILAGELAINVAEVEADFGEETRWWRDIKFLLDGPSGERFVGGITVEITDQKQATAEIQEAYDEISRLKDRLEAENVYLRQEARATYRHEQIVGSSPGLRNALQQAEQVAETETTVLIEGETGTGKELFADAIHNLSPRKERTLVKVNCAALPETLIESELFGREKGAYTGALTRRAGRFEIADRSTIFLDEIAELSPTVQVKLLRVLQEGRFERLGSSTSMEVDVRVIAATNRDLRKAVEEGAFREDLYYRLMVFPIVIPPLRQRREDIPQLVWHFVSDLNDKMGKKIEQIGKRTMADLQSYPWPGNVRELRNVIEHAMIISTGPKLTVKVPEPVGSRSMGSRTLESVERGHIVDVLEQTQWRVRGTGGAAEILGLKPTTLASRMKKLGIERPR